MTRRGAGFVDRWPREKQRGRAHRAPGVMSGRRSVMVLVMVLALAHALANIGLCARGALDDATRCGDAIVRKVSRIGPRGIEILIESTEEVEVLVNGACKVSNVEVKRHGICVAVAPHQLTNAIEFVRALDFKRDRVEVQVWYATLPPRLLVDTTSNKRHALKLLDLELASDESFGESKVVHTSAIIRILDAFTHGDEAWEESQDAKSFVVIGGPALEPDESNRVLELPRSGSARMYRLDTPKNVRTIVEEIQQRKFHRASCCTSVSRSSFALSINGAVCRVRSPSLDTIRHLPVSTNCTAEKYTEEIILQFTPEERKSFESRRSFLRGSFEDMIVAKQKFSLSLRFDGGPPIPAEGRFRGVSSFRDCERRKSLAVSVKKNGPLRLMPGTVTDQFLLISLCYDDRYVKTFLVFHMAKELGLFPLSFRFVRLKVASGSTLEEEGLYLLVDDPKAALRRQHVALTDVVRRRFDPARGTMDPKSEPDVSAYPKSFRNSLAARVRYERIVLASENCSDVGTACFDQLDELLDMDGYLRWLALMTWVQSGDYVDEVWFYASETSNGRHRHQLLIWDPDDSFESCHHGGVDAIGDSDLLYCAEGAIDKVLFRSEHMWSRYIENLNLVLRELPKRRLREIVSLEENQIRKLLSEDKNSYSGLLELLRIVPSIDSSKKAISEIIGSLRYYETLINFRRRSLLRHPVAYAWNGTDAWTPAPTLDVCDEKAAQVETQVRSYDLPNQEILIRVRAERAYALNLTFSPTVVYNGSTYDAIRDEFVLESWSEDVHLTPTNALSATRTESECDRTFIGGGYLVLSHVCNATNHQRLFSLHHRFWHSLANTSERMMNVSRLLGCL